MAALDIVIEINIEFVDKDSNPRPGRIYVGRPYKNPTSFWFCPVAIEGLHTHLSDIAGTDPLRSLLLAVGLIKGLLSSYCDKGGQIFLVEDGERRPLELKRYFNLDLE